MNLKRAFLFFLILSVIYIAGLAVFSNGKLANKITNVKNLTGAWGNSLERFREAGRTDSVDILFVGSSHTYRGFDPRIFSTHGISSFNLGTSGQTPYNTWYLLQEYLPQIHPSAIVLDVYWGVFASEDGAEATVDIICNAGLNGSYTEMALRSKNMLVYNSVLADIINKTFKPLGEWEQEQDPYNKYIPGGFVENCYPADTNAIKKGLIKSHITMQPLQMEYFIRTLKLIKARKIPAAIILTPVLPAYTAMTEGYGEFCAAIDSLSRCYDIPFLDYTQPENAGRLNLDPAQDFYDKDHLRQSGVVKFNSIAVNDLKQLFKL